MLITFSHHFPLTDRVSNVELKESDKNCNLLTPGVEVFSLRDRRGLVLLDPS